jgi:hypothetical protein
MGRLEVFVARDGSVSWERNGRVFEKGSVRVVGEVVYFYHPNMVHHCNCEKNNFFRRCRCQGYSHLFEEEENYKEFKFQGKLFIFSF